MSPSSLLRYSLAVLLTSAGVIASANTVAADIESLAGSDTWQALLHINRGSTIHSRGESYVDDEQFFLSPDGAQNAAAELEASISALSEPGTEARCRFPARLKFIGGELGWDLTGALDHCADYLEFSAQIPRGRAVLIFPASYLNSPSSMFGHTLLRLDKTENPDSVWESWAVNFGAAVSGDENSIFYVYRGLAGGYPGRFVIVPYVKKIQEYSNLENRDMWEYDLDLDRQEIDRLVDHLWELNDINFDYYFLDENCSFRLLELVDVARPGSDILDGFRMAEAPVNTVRVMQREDLVEERFYRASKAEELKADIALLTPDQRQLALRMIDEPSAADSDEFMQMSESERHLTARVAYQTLRFRHRKEDTDADVSRRSFALLRLMNENDAGDYPPMPEPAAPEDGHGTQRFLIGAGQRENLDFGDFGYRFTYHDLIDNNRGFLKGAQIEGLDLLLRSTESEEVKLERLDIVHIRSHSPRGQFIKPISWFVNGGIERAPAGGRERLVRFIQGGPGLSWQFGPVMPYFFVTARLENNSAYTPLLQAGAGSQAGVLFYLGHSQWDLGSRGIYFGNDEYRYRHSLSSHINLGRQAGIRVEAWQDHWREDVGPNWRDSDENGFSVSWHFYID